MLRRSRWVLIGIAAASLTACGSEIYDDLVDVVAPSPSQPINLIDADVLHLRATDPGHGAVQVSLGQPIELRFDGILAMESLAEPETWLRANGDPSPLPGRMISIDGGKGFRFYPDQPFLPETDYEFQLSPFTCDQDGRLLESTLRIQFRTEDHRGPELIHSNLSDGATEVEQQGVCLVEADERLDPRSVNSSTVLLRDLYGLTWPCDARPDGHRIEIRPLGELAGSNNYVLAISGVEDLAGNRQPWPFVRRFRTRADSESPTLLAVWPAEHHVISPLAWLELRFDESIDARSVGPATLRLLELGEHPAQLSYQSQLSEDRRTLWIAPREPLQPGTELELQVDEGPHAITDASGNALRAPLIRRFTVGADDRAPQILAVYPEPTSQDVPINDAILVRFDEPVYSSESTPEQISLHDHLGRETPSYRTTLSEDRRQLRIDFDRWLEPQTEYRLELRGGQRSLRDVSGNPFAGGQLSFRTTPLTATPSLVIAPDETAGSLSPLIQPVAVADQPLLPDSVRAANVTLQRVADDSLLEASVELLRGDRVILIRPVDPLLPGREYRITLRGGAGGIRQHGGNLLAADVSETFRIGSVLTGAEPLCVATANGVDPSRHHDQVLPVRGFTLDVRAYGTANSRPDPASYELELVGDGPTPDPEQLFAASSIHADGLQLLWQGLPDLAPGDYQFRATVADLTGRRSSLSEYRFRVEAASPELLPFERTQVVWVRFDLDRDHNGRADFDDDLLRLGLLSNASTRALQQRMSAIMREGVLARAHQLFSRRANGGRQGAGSVAIRLTQRRPLGIPHMQIACGGTDPEGEPDRHLGSPSTGALGRAIYDPRNEQINELAIGSNPGLGVFPGELLLFEARLYLQLVPDHTTFFGDVFGPLAPGLGGTPAGQSPADSKILAEDFDWATASNEERSRYLTLLGAADDWATAVGTILAHEIGHSVGLVAPGRGSRGLHGDNSYHNEFADIEDIMATSTGFQTLVEVERGFRDLNLAYLRHRVLLR